ncbi:DNA-processing protein DprA [Pseudomonas sp. NFACC45]|uniref:DNA-processing protein DprA n=1 Tax=Pseudomonas sp. NFACC45 TaxID=1566201 RepID=UPI0008E6339B|nr:DNA-processing protein DprA [Pseudomonas sp. NFACC45]SFH38757.1 DNA protecting protein DprA [Pseudomonas sp. NFACC45]
MALDQRIFWKNERIAFLALATLKGVGFWTLHQLATSKAGFKNTFKSNFDKYIKLEEGAVTPLAEIKKKLWQRGIRILEELAKENIALIFHEEDRFPAKLRNIHDAPQWLFVQGNLSILNTESIAIVGTRKPTEEGMFLTRLILATLYKSRFSTVSGLALGIDQLAHLESIKYGLPTIAVLGTGIRESYPKGSEPIRKMILESGGAVITEYLPTQTYSSENFVRRNRIQAALSNILIPVEWKIKSGTAHTVGFAAKYNKKIINIYLPKTLQARPEIIFSRNTYGATEYEMPLEIPELLSTISSPLEESATPTIEPNGQLGLEL